MSGWAPKIWTAPTLTPEQVEIRAIGTGRIYERMWDYLCDGDPE